MMWSRLMLRTQSVLIIASFCCSHQATNALCHRTLASLHVFAGGGGQERTARTCERECGGIACRGRVDGDDYCMLLRPRRACGQAQAHQLHWYRTSRHIDVVDAILHICLGCYLDYLILFRDNSRCWLPSDCLAGGLQSQGCQQRGGEQHNRRAAATCVLCAASLRGMARREAVAA
jgi:hypothetical protein